MMILWKTLFNPLDAGNVPFLANQLDSALCARLLCIIPSVAHQFLQLFSIISGCASTKFFTDLTNPARDLMTYLHLLQCCCFSSRFDWVLLLHFLLRFLKSVTRAYSSNFPVHLCAIFVGINAFNWLLVMPRFAQILLN